MAATDYFGSICTNKISGSPCSKEAIARRTIGQRIVVASPCPGYIAVGLINGSFGSSSAFNRNIVNGITGGFVRIRIIDIVDITRNSIVYDLHSSINVNWFCLNHFSAHNSTILFLCNFVFQTNLCCLLSSSRDGDAGKSELEKSVTVAACSDDLRYPP